MAGTLKSGKRSGGEKPGRRRLPSRRTIKYGAWADLSLRGLDQRTKVAKAIQQIEAELVGSLGNDPSPQERLIIQRASVKTMRRALLKRAVPINLTADPETVQAILIVLGTPKLLSTSADGSSPSLQSTPSSSE